METLKTDTLTSGGSGEPASAALSEVPHIVIAWSREEPQRLGEAAAISGSCILGRGGPRASDPAQRVVFYRQRPSGSTPMPPLEGPRISRVQLELSPSAGGGINVRSVGSCPFFINGKETTSGTAAPGDTLTLRNALVLLVMQRKRRLDSLRAYPESPAHLFGRADAQGIVGESPAAWAMREALAFAAQSAEHTLILGESGVGKEFAARAIHALSPRRDRPLVSRNAATLPEGLVDAELFGTAKGYPSAGMPERLGLIGEADGGILFLDEISELPPHLQAHLLRVLDQDGEYQRLGESRMRRSNLRLVAATNRSITALNHDFAARFAMRVQLPSFAERREDVPLLLTHLLESAARESPALVNRFFERRAGALAEPRIDPRLIEALLRHRFTHHLRELSRFMWLALEGSPDTCLTMTPKLQAELRRASALEGEDVNINPRTRGPVNTSEPDSAGAASRVTKSTAEAEALRTRASALDSARPLGLRDHHVLHRLMKTLGFTTPDKGKGGDGGS